VEKKTQQTTDYSELPQELIDAHADGRVVFFVGAGASCASPSKLPLFKDLAEKMGEEAESPYQEGEPIDTFLGRLTSLKPPYNVHKRAKVLLDPSGSRPNDIHKTIVRLASAYNRFRVVTTNFDLHLEKAAEDEKIKIPDIWNSPALPLGDQMEGLVHLHGSVTRSSNELILTDRDLGRAYLYEAWATRFLRTLFQENVVVFIGYGLNDPTMRYLTLALPSNASLYAFLHEDEVKGQDWKRLNVKTISFGRSYENLLPSLQNWLNLVKGEEAYRNRFDRIVSSGVDNLTEADDSFLSMLFSRVDAAKGFVEATDSASEESKLEWLHWLETRPEFKRLFDPEFAVRDNEAFDVLGRWFVKNFIASPDLHGAAFQTVQKMGQSMSVSLYREALQSALDLAEKDKDAARRWKAFMLTSVVGRTLNFREYRWLLADGVPEDLFTLRSILRPYLKIEHCVSGSECESDEIYKLFETKPKDIPDVEVSWVVDKYLLTKSVQKAVELANPGDSCLGVVLEDSLAEAYELLEAYYGKERSEQNSHIRHGIEPHKQDQSRSEWDAVIDGLRDYGEKAIQDRRHTMLPDRWWSFGRTLFRRLALHLVSVDKSRTADEKIEWALSREALFNFDLKHELYQVFKAAIGDALEEVRNKVLVSIENHVPLEDDASSGRDYAYVKYNLLVWLTTFAPEWEAALTMKKKLEVENGFKPREHPNTDCGGILVSVGEKPPMSVDDFLANVETNVHSLLDDLLSLDYSEWKIYGPSWGGLVSLFQEAVDGDPSAGIALWEDLVARGVLNGNEDTRARREVLLLDAVVDGWSKAEMDESLLVEVTERVSSCVSDPRWSDRIGYFLFGQIKKRAESDDTESVRELRKLAMSLLCTYEENCSDPGEDDSLVFYKPRLQSRPDLVARYWVKEAARRRSNCDFDYRGFTDEERNAFATLLEAPRPVLNIVQPILAGKLRFLHTIDSEFVREYIFPIFLERDSSKYAWNGYLLDSAFDDCLLNEGFFTIVFKQWLNLEGIEVDHWPRYYRLVASILSCSSVRKIDLERLANRSAIVNSGQCAPEFAKAVVSFLGEGKVDGAKVWRKWLGKHLERRLEGIPRTSTIEELACWADVVPYLGEAIPNAVSLLNGYNIGFQGFYPLNFPLNVFDNYKDELISHYVKRMQNTKMKDLDIASGIFDLVNYLRQVLDEDALDPFLKEIKDKGYHVKLL
jgi:hypothetical protein